MALSGQRVYVGVYGAAESLHLLLDFGGEGGRVVFRIKSLPGWRQGVVLAALLSLGACMPQNNTRLSGVSAAETGGLSALFTPGRTVDTGLIRAPEVFSASGTAIWDGVRTTRGVWVAHPKARENRRVRILHSQTGAEVDAMLYRSDRTVARDVVTISSDAAAALGLQPDTPARLSIFGLRAQGETSRRERRAVETSAQSELASHISRMAENDLLQLTAAAMRGMGYATVFEPGPAAAGTASIYAFPRPDAGQQIPSIRLIVRPKSKSAMTATELGRVQTWLTGTGDLGVVVSVPGFAQGAERALRRDAVHLEMVDLDGLLNIWLTQYEGLSPPDRALLPLQPIYFLAGR